MGVAQVLKTVDIAGFKCWNKDHIEGPMRYSYRLVGLVIVVYGVDKILL